MEERTVLVGERWKEPKAVLMLAGILLVGAVVITALVRERIVSPRENQVTVTGQGKVAYQPDIAVVTLGVQIDKAQTAESALNQLNEKINKVVESVVATGVKRENIQTQNYSVYPQYDFVEGRSVQSGYNAAQQLSIKVENIQEDKDAVSAVIAEAGKAGTNQVNGISFDVSSVSDLRQQARILAVADAKAKAAELSQVTGTRLGKIVGWYENVLGSPEPRPVFSSLGYGGDAKESSANVPTGTQEIVVEMGLNYEVK
ncbi:MAG TPA: hypothetical protein DCX32_03025 [Candidatus Moranbacteria bacterium]|nr:MAG: hypothetical protein UW87_C0002G0048 [Candidatus Moranbacteria bacterium GW2011_GWC2_45_10]KKT95217.1 MAG: hypothetical protein UW95_C0003G0059 [Parcubacteria group bacterium GW2011_GWC1_45_14]HAV11492.1 hypothetical protein [Candidatus Moranbacteria bacterium]